MKTILTLCAAFLVAGLLLSCGSGSGQTEATGAVAGQPAGGGQSTVADNDSQKDVVRIAVGSADHTTLVAALKAAEYVDVLSNAGPFTVFAPTNSAFDKLPDECRIGIRDSLFADLRIDCLLSSMGQ